MTFHISINDTTVHNYRLSQHVVVDDDKRPEALRR
jgi:hypothetical protein